MLGLPLLDKKMRCCQRPSACANNANCAQVAVFREISATARLRGGPGRGRMIAVNQSVTSRCRQSGAIEIQNEFSQAPLPNLISSRQSWLAVKGQVYRAQHPARGHPAKLVARPTAAPKKGTAGAISDSVTGVLQWRHTGTGKQIQSWRVLQHHNGRGTPPHDHCADSCIVLSGLRRDHYRLARTTDSIRKGARLDLQSFSVGSKPHRDTGNGVESDRNINGGQRPSAKIIIINSKKTTQTRDTMQSSVKNG